MAPYITNKLNRFVGSDFVRPIIGQARSTIDFRTFMDEGKVLLVNLNKGVLGDVECRLVGMLLLAKVFSAALERAAEPMARRRPFHLYVDEAQNFLTPIVGSILAEARKFGLSMTLANQNLAQWAGGSSRSLLDTILGNVGSLLLFRVGPEDAERLSTFTRPEFSARDLQYLPDRTVVAKMLANGRPLPPFTFETLPPMAEGSEYRRRAAAGTPAPELRRAFAGAGGDRSGVATSTRGGTTDIGCGQLGLDADQRHGRPGPARLEWYQPAFNDPAAQFSTSKIRCLLKQSGLLCRSPLHLAPD